MFGITFPGWLNSISGYDFSNNFGKKEEMSRSKSEPTEKSGLMASALAMQKERDTDTDKSGGRQKNA